MNKLSFNVPTYRPKDDPDLWLYRYNKAAKMNDWNDSIKLMYVDNCFNEKMQKWFMREDFQSWKLFEASFMNKYSKKINIDKIVNGIRHCKMLPHDRIDEYIERYEVLRANYNEYIKIKGMNNQCEITTPTSKAANDKQGTSSQPDSKNEQSVDIECIITEIGFKKYFIRGLASSSMKRLIKKEKPQTLEDIYSLLRDVYGTSDDDFSDSDPDSDTDNEDVKTEPIDGVKKKRNSKSTTDNEKNTNSSDSGIAELTKGFNSMTLLIGEMVNNSKIGSAPKKDRPTCWNCLSKDHFSRECTEPCKYCRSSGHRHFECEQHKRNKTIGNKPNPQPGNEAMLIEELYLLKNRNARVTRSGKAVDSTPKRKTNNTVAAINAPDEDHEMTNITPLANNEHKQRISILAPKHPLLPLTENQGGVDEKAEFGVISRIFNESVHQVSLRDLATLSPVARSKLKGLMTKPQLKKSDKINSGRKAPEANTVLLSEETRAPKGKSAPRAFAEINGVKQEVILDGGCVV
ncbi:hypothetical protein G6F43_012478 [Rhizopus delemar]|nr:hypothetical protein G6F43_012478 [Rhizopus delemar]